MNGILSRGIQPSVPLYRWLSIFAICLLPVFLAGVLSAAVPRRLIDPQWQLTLVAALVNNAILCVLSGLLLALAVWMHAASDRLRARLRLFRRWALAAPGGFPPRSTLNAHHHQQQQQSSQASQRLADLRAAIASAASHQQLQATVRKIFGPGAGLSQEELRTPMPELRVQLLAKAEQGAQQLMQQIEARSAATSPEPLLKETARLALASLAYAAGFAFFSGALPRGQNTDRSRASRVDEAYFKVLAE